jgi:hypothetical protein
MDGKGRGGSIPIAPGVRGDPSSGLCARWSLALSAIGKVGCWREGTDVERIECTGRRSVCALDGARSLQNAARLDASGQRPPLHSFVLHGQKKCLWLRARGGTYFFFSSWRTSLATDLRVSKTPVPLMATASKVGSPLKLS